ncbi:hypothetical protein HanXRQr2_Chr16g0765141 [Helianthus annuus]|uniref:Uncharacterized protein n=1 Tax=Helianthus annuus TaxID=4232 RepID=A0A9K3GZ95_HELAN|nr:hypothetical protein HanXRQr2_Chr16g0765141 [Helianthus annuus]KAJ0822542.1 hypothetical protein HanPSC8_Chr16g0733301 [Helianthus annuus]
MMTVVVAVMFPVMFRSGFKTRLKFRVSRFSLFLARVMMRVNSIFESSVSQHQVHVSVFRLTMVNKSTSVKARST